LSRSLLEFVRQCRFADSSFTGYEDDLALSARRPVKTTFQTIQHSISTNQLHAWRS
jgi:hypothetical protein